MGMQTTLPPLTVSARDARRFVAEALHQNGRAKHADVAVLLVGELVTNAVLHARTEVVVGVSVTPEAVRIEVLDTSRVVPVSRRFGVEASTGRGLLLVEELSDAWGTDVGPQGKTVWFELTEKAA